MINSRKIQLLNSSFTVAEIQDLQGAGVCISADGSIINSINYNILAQYILDNFIYLLVSSGGRFYSYKPSMGVWVQFEDIQFERDLYSILSTLTKTRWTSKMESEIIKVFQRRAHYEKKMNSNTEYLNVLNGMVNIHSKRLKKHKRTYYSTVQVPIKYDVTAECLLFERVLKDIFEDDTDRIAVFQEIMGAMLSSRAKMQTAFFFLGAGSNGKSLLIKVIEYLLGKDNISNVSLEEFSKPFSRVQMVDKLANVSSEGEVSKKCVETAFFKAIVAGDSVQVENKFKDAFSTVLNLKLLFAVNTLPNSEDTTYGYLRRFLILPFRRIFNDEEADIDLFDKLIPEMPGILNFALAGLERLMHNGCKFTTSDAVKEAIDEYKAEQNPLFYFFKECLKKTKNPEERLNTTDIWLKFRDWCYKNDSVNLYSDMQRDKRAFWRYFRNITAEKGISIPHRLKKSNGTTYIQGFRLKKETQSVDK